MTRESPLETYPWKNLSIRENGKGELSQKLANAILKPEGLLGSAVLDMISNGDQILHGAIWICEPKPYATDTYKDAGVATLPIVPNLFQRLWNVWLTLLQINFCIEVAGKQSQKRGRMASKGHGYPMTEGGAVSARSRSGRNAMALLVKVN